MKTIKWKDLKKFVNDLNEDQLENTVHVFIEDADVASPITEAFLMEDDIYSNEDEPEDCGSLEDLKSAHMEDFDESQYRICTPKGTPFLYIE